MASYLSSVVGVWKPIKCARMAAAPQPDAPRRSSPPLSEDDARSFCSSVSEDLRALEWSLDEGSISLRWSADAVRVLKKTHAGLLALLRRSGLPISFGAKECWFDLYMEESAILLDFCNHLRLMASGISRYRMVLDLTIQKIESGCTPDFEAVEAEHQNLLEGSRQREATATTRSAPEDATVPPPEQIRHDNSATGVAMLAAKWATVAISLILVSSFVSPVSFDVGDEEVAQLGPLAGSLSSLVKRFRERCSGGGPGMVLAEHELVRKSVGDLRRQLEQGRAKEDVETVGRRVELLRQESRGLKEAIEVFDAAVDEMFDEMIKGRNELLGTFSDGALT